MRGHLKKFSRLGDLATRICSPLVINTPPALLRWLRVQIGQTDREVYFVWLSAETGTRLKWTSLFTLSPW
jgi:hypothetical protein